MSDLLFFRKHDTGKAYKTGSKYGDSVWVLLPFGWVISTSVKRDDLNDQAEFTPITKAEI